MTASIIIPTRDKLSRLRLVLQALTPQIDQNTEVIVVFDGCSEETIKGFYQLHFSYEPIVIICKNNVGRSKARNMGIRKAKGDIIIFLDDDRIPCPDFVEIHRHGHHEKCALLGTRSDIVFSEKEIETLYDTKVSFNSLLQQAKTENQTHYPIRWLCFFTGNCSVTQNDLKTVGLFDENLTRWGHEDLDLGIRLHLKHIKLRTIDRAINIHLVHESNFSPEKYWDSVANIKYLIKKYRRHIFICGILCLMYIKFKVIGIRRVNYSTEFRELNPSSDNALLNESTDRL